VLLFAAGVGKAEVNKLDLVFLDHFHDVCDGLCHQNLLFLGGKKMNSVGITGDWHALFMPRIQSLQRFQNRF
jgi:hypothetical protein